MSCVKCGGATRQKVDKDIGAYAYCDHCGPQYTPPYTPERIAKAGGGDNVAAAAWKKLRERQRLDEKPQRGADEPPLGEVLA